MMNVVKYINFEDVGQALPAFLTMIMMPLTYSLVSGIALGLISYTVVMIFSGKGRRISKYTYIITLVFIIQFALLK